MSIDKERLDAMLKETMEHMESLSEEELAESYNKALAKAEKESKALHDARKVNWDEIHKPCTI